MEMERRLTRDASERPRELFPELNPHLPSDFIHGGRIREASILIPIVERRSGPSVLLTLRSSDMPSHAGEIGFPGGRRHDDDRDEIHTALRETEEELGLACDHISVAGRMRRHIGGRGYSVTPVVGYADDGIALDPDAREVAEVFEVPFDYLMDPANHMVEERRWGDVYVNFFAIPYKDWHIWGLTAGIIQSLSRVLRD